MDEDLTHEQNNKNRQLIKQLESLAKEGEAARELDKRLAIPKSYPRRRERVEAVADRLGFPYDARFTQSQVLERLRVAQGETPLVNTGIRRGDRRGEDDLRRERSSRRREWFNQLVVTLNTTTTKVSERPGAPTFNTLQKYLEGYVTRQTSSVRGKLAKCLKLSLSMIPE